MIFFITVIIATSEAGGVLERVGAGICEATGCCDSGCGADNASVLRERNRYSTDIKKERKGKEQKKTLLTVTFLNISTVSK